MATTHDTPPCHSHGTGKHGPGQSTNDGDCPGHNPYVIASAKTASMKFIEMSAELLEPAVLMNAMLRPSSSSNVQITDLTPPALPHSALTLRI
jgi:hypothetical protein